MDDRPPHATRRPFVCRSVSLPPAVDAMVEMQARTNGVAYSRALCGLLEFNGRLHGEAANRTRQHLRTALASAEALSDSIKAGRSPDLFLARELRDLISVALEAMG